MNFLNNVLVICASLWPLFLFGTGMLIVAWFTSGGSRADRYENTDHTWTAYVNDDERVS